MEDDGKGLGDEKKVFTYSYIKPLGGSIGPKQTKCLVTINLDSFDLEKAVSVTCSTQTPDVPSGNIFVTKTKYCLMWGPGNSTRIIMNCTVEWSGKSWLKGPIEKGANDGQAQYGKDVAAFFRSQIAAKSSPVKTVKSGKTKSKKKRAATDLGSSDGTADIGKAAGSAGNKSDTGGVLSTISSIFGPAGDLVAPMLSPSGILSLLLAMMMVLYWRQSYRTGSLADPLRFPGVTSPQRLAAYDKLWQHEESQLWEWLEDRLRLDEYHVPASIPSPGNTLKSMSDRQVDDAIRVTEERLQALKDMVQNKRVNLAEESSEKEQAA